MNYPRSKLQDSSFLSYGVDPYPRIAQVDLRAGRLRDCPPRPRGRRGISPSPAVIFLLWRAFRRQYAVVVAIKHVCVFDHCLPGGRRRPDVIRQLPRKPAEQMICVGDGDTDRSGQGAVRKVQLGRDELMRQDQAGIAPGRGVEERQELGLRVRLAP